MHLRPADRQEPVWCVEDGDVHTQHLLSYRVDHELTIRPNPNPLSLDPPDAPNTPRVHEVTASTAHLSWYEPKDNGSPILGYWIERKEVNSKHWTRVNRALINSLEVKVSNLMEGLTYIFRVCAENLAGPGPFSEPSDRTTAMDAICKYCV